MISYNVYCQSSGSGSISSNHQEYFAINGNELVNEIEYVNVKSPNAYIHITDGSFTVRHNPDGSKEIPFTASIEATSYGVEATISRTFTCSTIPRTSSIAVSTVTIGSNSTITINRASSSFTHTLRYEFGTVNGTITTKTSSTSVNWSVPTSFYNIIPNSKTGTGKIYCDTYNGNSLIGTSSISFTAYTNENSCKPTATYTIIDTNSKTIALTGSNTKLIKYNSNAKISVSPSAKNSATIANVKINGNTYTSGYERTINKVETNSFTIIVTDSRGYSTTYTSTSTMVNYIPLTINATINRPSPTTGEIDMSYNGNYFNGSFGSTNNTLSVSYKWKLSSDTSYTDGTVSITPTISNNTYSRTKTKLGDDFTYTNSYDFAITVSDKLSTITYTTKVSQGKPVFNWGKDFLAVNGSFSANTVKGKIESIYARQSATDANIEHTYENSKQHMSLIPVTSSMTSNKPAGDGYILNFSWDNSGSYEGQLFIPDGTDTQMQYRGCDNGTWKTWEDLYRAKVLYDNSTGSTGTITLSETANNFKYMEIFYGKKSEIDNTTIYKSTRVHSPNNKKVELSAFYKASTSVSQNIYANITISGTSITKKYYCSVNIGNDKTITNVDNNDNSIVIYKVLGYR